MSLETTTNLNEETISAIQDLIQLNIDSSKGFLEAAKQVDDSDLTALFRKLSGEREALAIELQGHVQLTGERPRTEGTWLGATHRMWLDIRAKLNGGESLTILSDAANGETFIKAAYEELLKKTAGSAVNDVLQTQYAKVKAGYDEIVALRETHELAS